MAAASVAEIASIGAVLPFLGVLAAPDRWFRMPVLRPLVQIAGARAPDQLILPFTILFCIGAVLAGVTRLVLLWATTRVSFGAGADLSIEIYRRTLYQPYAVHVARNTSEVISAIVHQTVSVIQGAFLPAATLLGSSILVVSIVGTLLVIDPSTAVAALLGVGLLYGVTSRLTDNRLRRNGAVIAARQAEVMKSLQEGLGGIRDVLIDGSQQVYCDVYRRADASMRTAEGNNASIAQSPKFVMEAIGMVLIAGLAWTFRRAPGGISTAIPILGAFALGAQRLMPPLHQAYASWVSIVGSEASLQHVLELLAQPLPAHAGQANPAPIPFDRAIELRDIGFRYGPDLPWVLRHFNLAIPKGSRIGLKGTTGSGKSTLTDLVMGLLDPTEGAVIVDGQPLSDANRRSWQVRVAHVPQTIFLADTTIAANIAFGIPGEHIDMERVREAARQAQIADEIASWPEQYETRVGERGIRLSGGQRQRIGIARALYKRASVIVFDEATSALDNETEQSVIASIEALGRDVTLLMIAHRLTTLRSCDAVVDVGASASSVSASG
jgi:ATP-binding cassette subfamily B protein